MTVMIDIYGAMTFSFLVSIFSLSESKGWHVFLFSFPVWYIFPSGRQFCITSHSFLWTIICCISSLDFLPICLPPVVANNVFMI